MRAKWLFFLVLLLAAAMLAAGCGGTQQAQEDEKEQGGEQAGEQQTHSYLIATGGTGGTYYPLGGAISQVWKDNVAGLDVTVTATGASVENLRLLASGETHLAMAMNGPAQAAWTGKGDFEGNQINNIAAVGVIYPEVMQIIAPAGAGIEKVADLKGKRVSIGPVGSGTASAALTILESFELDPDQDIQKFQDNFADAARKIKDGQLDAAFAVLAVPAGNVIDITTSTPVTIVDVDGEGLQKMLEADPTFSPYEIPGGTYEGQDDAAYTVSQWAVLYVQKELPEDIIYEMTKVMYEKTEDIARGHDRGNQINIDNALKGVEPVELHPGAVKYYTEKGLM